MLLKTICFFKSCYRLRSPSLTADRIAFCNCWRNGRVESTAKHHTVTSHRNSLVHSYRSRRTSIRNTNCIEID